MACQKVCKQGRDDISVKVNLQSPIPTSFTLQLQTSVKRCRDEALYVYLHTYIIPIPCLHTFWHAIPTSPYIFNAFY